MSSTKENRTTAKRKFTLERKRLMKAVNQHQNADSIKNSFSLLCGLWETVKERHDNYLQSLNADSESEEHDSWIEQISDKFSEAEQVYYNHFENIEIEIKNDRSKNAEVVQTKLKTERSLKMLRFNGQADMLRDLLRSGIKAGAIEIIKEARGELKSFMDAVAHAHEDYISSLEPEQAMKEMEWILDIQDNFRKLSLQYTEHLANVVETKPKERPVKTDSLKLERMKLPRFSGELRDYIRFKDDFIKFVIPEVEDSKAAYMLKSCLDAEPLKYVKNIENSINKVWERLDERYGQPSKIAELIVNEIKRHKYLNDNDDKGLVRFIETLESNYLDLELVGMKSEISNLSMVSLIEEKLPNTVKRKWAEEVSKDNSCVDKRNPFPSLLSFLKQQRRIIEYISADLRTSTRDNQSKDNAYNAYKYDNAYNAYNAYNVDKTLKSCYEHNTNGHSIASCTVYLSKSNAERVAFLKEKRACWNCLAQGHRMSECPKKTKCSVDNCNKFHSETLHNACVEGVIFKITAHDCNEEYKNVIFQIMSVPTITEGVSVNVFWDGGSNCSLITFRKAREMKLMGKPTKLRIQRIGEGVHESKIVDSACYALYLLNKEGKAIPFNMYGIENISSGIKNVNTQEIKHLFPKSNLQDIPAIEGEIDVLIGLEYAAQHPQIIDSNENLIVSKNAFGKSISGTHSLVKGVKGSVQRVAINHIIGESIDNFFNSESLRKSKSANCKQCKHGEGSLTLKEERENKLIERGLIFRSDHWEATYPLIKDPNELPNNAAVAVAIMKSQEKRLMKDEKSMQMYQEQMDDMKRRGVIQKLSSDEIREYKGPCYHISHHEVWKLSSESTPCRIVFHSSRDYKGHVLNDYWAKGSSLINNLQGILLRFRGYIGIMGDIKKMYHSIRMSVRDQHMHRFFWRDFNTNKWPDTYVMTRVCFGDRPSGTIAITALKKTAEMASDEFQDAKDMVQRDTYVDDVIGSVDDIEISQQIISQIEKMLAVGGFEMKSWVVGGVAPEEHNQTESLIQIKDVNGKLTSIGVESESTQKVLGVNWDSKKDRFQFSVRLNHHKKKHGVRLGPDIKQKDMMEGIPVSFTKRIILSWVNGLYDPLGLVAPFLVRAKILMRKLWTGGAKGLGWDDVIEASLQSEWNQFFLEMFDVEKCYFKRCIKPIDVADDDVKLIIFCDSSELAYGACAYARWRLKDGSYHCRLLMAKTHVAPLSTISIVKLELNGAKLGAQLKTFIEEESKLKLSKVYLLVDSQIIWAMIQKDSYLYNTYCGVRIAEIQETTDTKDWYWVRTDDNIADWLTRGKSPSELSEQGRWQAGPTFISLPESEWPIEHVHNVLEIPYMLKTVMQLQSWEVDTLESRIGIDNYSSFMKLLRVTCRILAMYKRDPLPSLSNALSQPTTLDYGNATLFWVKDAQSSISHFEKRFTRLGPVENSDGIYVVGKRVEKWLENSYNETGLILLPQKHRLSYLYALFIHHIGHNGVATTVSKIRLKFWIVKVQQVVKPIVKGCVTCRKNAKSMEEQIMSPLPIERLKPFPAFCNIMVDYFGPFPLKGEINKRSQGMGYGVLFTCLYTRAVFVDVAHDYSTDGFLTVFRRFVSIRGYPAKVYSDNGSQFTGASRELKRVLRDVDWEKICEFGAEAGVQWIFSAANAPWQNGCVESLVKSVKKAIKLSIGAQILKFSEMQTVLYEAANMVNERPIGKHPSDPDEGKYLCPNDMLLGRASPRVPGGPFKEVRDRRRFEFIQKIGDTFWKKWTVNYFPSLLLRQKWHTAKRSIMVGDIVLIKDSNTVRGNWKMGRVAKVKPSDDGFVRRCSVVYKRVIPGKDIAKCFITIERPVQDLIVIVPIDGEFS